MLILIKKGLLIPTTLRDDWVSADKKHYENSQFWNDHDRLSLFRSQLKGVNMARLRLCSSPNSVWDRIRYQTTGKSYSGTHWRYMPFETLTYNIPEGMKTHDFLNAHLERGYVVVYAADENSLTSRFENPLTLRVNNRIRMRVIEFD